jgi:peptidylprolyl isomerase
MKILLLASVLAMITPSFACKCAKAGKERKTQEMTTQETTTKSGLTYEDLKVGEGKSPQQGDTLTVHYTGWLKSNDQKFDSSVDRGTPFQFVIGKGQVIPGWDEGVATMKEGGKRKLTIPADLAYGAKGAGGVIPPNATLVFEVELLKVGK